MWTSPFLPLPASLQIERVESTATTLQIFVRSCRDDACCPDCHHASTRARSSYRRSLTDLPITGQQVTVVVRVRRFVCQHTDCPRRIFAEQFPTWAAPRVRSTLRHMRTVVLLECATSGAQGTRLAQELALRTSPSQLNRWIRALPTPPQAASTVVGIDDWSLRRGQRYGTIVVDLERHRMMDLIAERTADGTAAWLRAHPFVQVVSRDRGGSYAEGVRHCGRPMQQIADRWHLLKNLGDALEHLAARLQWGTLLAETLPPLTADVPVSVMPLPATLPLSPRQQERHAAIVQLHETGMSTRAMSRHLQLSRATVRRYVQGYQTQRARHPRASVLDPYRTVIFAQWQAGANAATIYQTIRAQGYVGQRSILRRLIHQWRQEGVSPTPRPRQRSPRDVRWLLARASERLTEEERAQRLTLLGASHEALATFRLYHRFWAMLRDRTPQGLLLWLEQAERTTLPELRAFAAGVRRDLHAVQNGFREPWSQGMVEGFITKLKLVKRQLYGRAKLDLLQQHLLHPV